MLGKETLLAAQQLHFFFISGNPECAALFVLHVLRKTGRQLTPEAPRVPSEFELRRGIIHHHDMSHAGRGCFTSDRAAIQHENVESGPSTFIGTGGSDDTCANNDDIVRWI